MKQTILDLWQENGRLSVIIQNEIMVQEILKKEFWDSKKCNNYSAIKTLK